MIELVERESALAQLAAAFASAAQGAGRTALVSGEAGIGKTSLVQAFADALHGRARVLWGGCEALFLPRPLGPVYDALASLPAGVRDLLGQEGRRPELFAAILASLREAPTAVFVVEDVHWADDATLDLVKYLGRRIAGTPALLVLTHRDDEVDERHPLRRVLGDLPSASVTRIPLLPLSARAVDEMARRAGRSGRDVYAASAGNPFFVTELLCADGLPATVLDAVLARATRVGPEARAVLDLAAIVPSHIERSLVDAVLAPEPDAVGGAFASGLLRADENGIAYRHELARIAAEKVIPAPRAQALHARVLTALEGGAVPDVASTRLVHHASRAGIASAVLRHARRAADDAAAHGAHREAAELLAIAIEHATDRPPVERARLFEARSYRCYLTEQIVPAIAARQSALAIWRTLGERLREGDALRVLSRLHWFAGDNAEAERYAKEALAVLEPLGPGRELAWAFSNCAQLYMLADRDDEALAWGERARALAVAFGDREIESHALNNLGATLTSTRQAEGVAALERSLGIALENNYEEHVSRAYANLTAGLVVNRDYAGALRWFDEAAAYFADRDLDSWSNYVLAWRSRHAFETGEWTLAESIAAKLVATSQRAVARIPALAVLARLRSRRGDPGADALVDEVVGLAIRTGELQRMGPALCARAEYAWVKGVLVPDPDLDAAYATAIARREARWIGEIGYWRRRAGAGDGVDAGAERPYVDLGAGRWREAAEGFEALQCPWERALALLEGDVPARLEALAIAEGLGAAAVAALVRECLHRDGVRQVPRGPRASTTANPCGLTTRELEILGLIALGLQNAEIARRIVRSEKTVDHHVSSILAKLDVRTRTEAAAVAHRLGVATPIAHRAAR